MTNDADDQTESSDIMFEGLRLHRSRRGSGRKTVIFVHGWACNQSIWREQFHKLANNYRVVTFDLPGHGRSQAPTDTEPTLDLFARAVEVIRADSNASRVVLVGHSLGVAVVLRYAALCPERVAALVLAEGAVSKRRTIAFDPARLVGENAKEVFEKFIATFLFSRSTTPAIQAHILAMMLGTPTATVVGVANSMLDPASWSDEPVNSPVLAIYKEKSRLAGQNVMRSRFPAIEYHEIVDTGHFLMIEKPDEFNRLLVEFLERQAF